MFMNKIGLTLISVLVSITCFAQQGRRTERAFEGIGLPDGGEIGGALKIAIPLLFVGFLIAYIFMWSKNDTSNTNEPSTYIGCVGVIIMLVGAFFLLPLLAWAEFIFISIFSIVIIVIVVAVIIGFIYFFFKK